MARFGKKTEAVRRAIYIEKLDRLFKEIAWLNNECGACIHLNRKIALNNCWDRFPSARTIYIETALKHLDLINKRAMGHTFKNTGVKRLIDQILIGFYTIGSTSRRDELDEI